MWASREAAAVGVNVLARLVVGLGEAARPETKNLADEARRIASAALANAR